MTKKQIPGYSYGAAEVPKSHVSMRELIDLQTCAGLTHEDHHFLRLAGEVLADQTKQIVEHWRSGIIASIRILRGIRARPKAIPFRNTWRRATFASSSGFWIRACGRTIRTG